MKVIPSSHPQVQWYPTPTGTADIRGDQAMSRIIAVIAKKSSWVPKAIGRSLTKIPPQGRSRSRLQPNSNYKVARTKTPTLSTSQELRIISQKRKSNCFTWIL